MTWVWHCMSTDTLHKGRAPPGVEAAALDSTREPHQVSFNLLPQVFLTRMYIIYSVLLFFFFFVLFCFSIFFEQ